MPCSMPSAMKPRRLSSTQSEERKREMEKKEMEKTNPKISVIVPVYNVERYLPRCIDSILAQTFTDFELLLIDDGSKDTSGEICDEYASKDSRVRVFHKENGGVSSARNLGLDNARGEWIAFCDSDDWVDKSYLYNYVEQIDDLTELVIQSFWTDREDDASENKVELPTLSMEDNFRLVQWLEDYPNVHNGFLWHRLFKRSIVERQHTRFAVGVSFAEDGLFFFQYLKDSHHFKVTSKLGYHYVIHSGSLTSCGAKISVHTHAQVLRGFVGALQDMDVPQACRGDFANFIRRYAWRLLESWILSRACKSREEKEECLRLVDGICNDCKLYDVHCVSMTLRCLAAICKMEPGTVQRVLLRSVLLIRKYEQKIKRHL